MRKRLISLVKVLLHPVVVIGSAIGIAAVVVGIAWQTGSVTPSGQYVAAVLAPITGVGGASSDLSFQVSGQVVAVPVSIGQTVRAGAALVELDRSSLLAIRAGAAANLEAATARLAAIEAGTRPEQITVDQTAITQAQESLRDVVRIAYINADDAVHNKTDQFFTNPRNSSAALSFILPNQTLQNTVQNARIALEPMLTTWGSQVNTVAFVTSDPLADAQLAETNLVQVGAFLDTVATALVESPASSALPLVTLQSYQTAINAARLAVSGSVTAITSATTVLQSAQGALTLAQAGATTHDVAAVQASVDAAQAVLSGIDVTLRESTLTSPIAGTITTMNAHLGQTVAPGQILVSITSSGGNKASALVVPSSSVIENGSQAFVYVKNGASAPTKTVVVVGLVSTSGMTEIVSGLTAGQEVLAFGTNTK